MNADATFGTPANPWMMVGAAVIGAMVGVLAGFAFLPFGQAEPPSLMATLAHDFSVMKRHPITKAYTSYIRAYTKAPILSDFRKQNIAAIVKQGSVVFSLPNGSMAAHFLQRCVAKYDCKVSGGNLGSNLKITVTPYTENAVIRNAGSPT